MGIIETLQKIETENNIKIIFASELGSRAWDLESADSDYDVRFVYKRPLKEYLKLNKPAESIQLMEGYGDYVGFDVYKFCGLLNASNPSAIEWILSEINYVNAPPIKIRQIIAQYYNPLALFQHYRSMCKQNYLDYLKTRGKATYKKYLYSMRGLLNSIYVQEYNKIPPIYFPMTIEKLNQDKKIPIGIYKKLVSIIRLKKEGQEKDLIENIVEIDEYIESKLKEKGQPESQKKSALTNEINEYLLEEIGCDKHLEAKP